MDLSSSDLVDSSNKEILSALEISISCLVKFQLYDTPHALDLHLASDK